VEWKRGDKRHGYGDSSHGRYRDVHAELHGKWRQRQCIRDSRGRRSCCANGHDLGEPGNDHAGSERDPDLVVDECGRVHGERSVEWSAVYQRHRDGNAHGGGNGYLHADLYGSRRQREPVRDANSERTGRTDCADLGIARDDHAGGERNTHLVLNECDRMHSQWRVERVAGNERDQVHYSDSYWH
jgi:hypothetical protein